MAVVSHMGTHEIVAAESVNVKAILLPVRSRISWGAIAAGVVIAMIVQIAMNMLGLSIGAAAVDPNASTSMVAGFGVAAVLWMAATIAVSLFAGGAVAGYMSGRIGRNEGLWHGLTVWGVTTIVSMLLLTSAAGTIVSGVASTLGAGLNLLGSTAADVVPAVADSANLQMSLMESIRNEAGMMQPQTTNTRNGSPTNNSTTDTDSTMAQTDTTPRAMNALLIMEVGNLMLADENSPQATTARQNAIALITDTGVSEADATATVTRWENDYRRVAADAAARAKQAAEDIANAVAATAGIAFIVIALGALAAGAGGLMGTPKSFADETDSRRVSMN